MTSGPTPPPAADAADTADESLRALLRRLWPALAATVVATLVVELGVFLAAVWLGLPPRQAALATLAATVLWVVLAAPALAAAGPGGFAALLRAGAAVDASGVTLLVLWAACEEVTFPAAAKAYIILAAMALASAAWVRLARTGPARAAVALVVAMILLACLATPFWIGGALRVADRPTAAGLAALAVHANPFYGVSAAIAERARFVWHESGFLYRITRLGDDAAPPPSLWYACPLAHAALAVLAVGLAGLRRRHPGSA